MTNTAERDDSRDSSTEQGRPQGRVDRRVAKTQAAIHRALEELVCEKPPHRITVAEITRRASTAYFSTSPRGKGLYSNSSWCPPNIGTMPNVSST